MKKIVIVFLFLGLIQQIALGQDRASVLKDFPFYFPENSFHNDTLVDKIINLHWSNFLQYIDRPILNENQSYQEYYRLVYQGGYMLSIDIFKVNENYIIVTDSLGEDDRIFQRNDTISLSESSKLSDTLKFLTEKLWNIKCYNHNNKEEIVIEDDRDNWLIEIKRKNNYHVFSRIEPEIEVETYINYLMKLGKFSGYRI